MNQINAQAKDKELMMGQLNPSEETKILEYFFVGKTFRRVSLGDWLVFDIGELTFQAHEVTFPQQNELLNLFRSASFPLLELPGLKATEDDVDPLRICEAVAVKRILHQTITAVRLLEDSSLEIRFDSGDTLSFPTDVDIVDWFWLLTERDVSPYGGNHILCTGPHEIWINMEKIAKWQMPF